MYRFFFIPLSLMGDKDRGYKANYQMQYAKKP